ncbi:hypothetical protein Goari_022846, partial [Gossypium aridum]|nr:hypothetical protein [Gossypium aridum]
STRGRGIYDYALQQKLRVQFLTYTHLHPSSFIAEISSNLLLDEKFRAKVLDFRTSKSISIDQTHLTTQVLGTFRHLDPEYF